MPNNYLSPEEELNYSNQRRTATSSYLGQKSLADLQNSNWNDNWGAQRQKSFESWGRARAKVGDDFAGRGVFNSGLYGRGLQEYKSDKDQDFGALARNWAENNQSYLLRGATMHDQYTNTMANIQSDSALRRAAIVAPLTSA
jgi:hypothetical protein